MTAIMVINQQNQHALKKSIKHRVQHNGHINKIDSY